MQCLDAGDAGVQQFGQGDRETVGGGVLLVPAQQGEHVLAFPGVRVGVVGWVAGLDREVEFMAASEPVAETRVPVGTDLCRGETSVTEFRIFAIAVQAKRGGESLVRIIGPPIADPAHRGSETAVGESLTRVIGRVMWFVRTVLHVYGVVIASLDSAFCIPADIHGCRICTRNGRAIHCVSRDLQVQVPYRGAMVAEQV